MSKKPIAIDQLKLILQLKTDGVPIREIVRRTGMILYTMHKYLAK